MHTKAITVLTLKELTALISEHTGITFTLSTNDYNPNNKIRSIDYDNFDIRMAAMCVRDGDWLTYDSALIYLAYIGVLSFGEYQIIDD